MERGLLARVVETEREILAKIESEKKKCDERLEEARKKAEGLIAREMALIQEENARSVREAEKHAEEEAAKVLEASKLRAERLGSIADEVLQDIIVKYLKRILPEERH